MEELEARLKPLWLRAMQGDEPGYREALALVAQRLRAYFRRRLTHGTDELEDLVQETLLALHMQRASYDPSQPLTAWVHAIARYKLVDLLRRRGRKEGLHDALDDVDEALLAHEAAELAPQRDLHQLLLTLPQAQRVAIELTKLEGLSVAQAAARTGASESAIKVQVHRGLKKLAALARS